MDTYYRQTDGDVGIPFEWGGEWKQFRVGEDGVEKPTGGYMKMYGNDAGGTPNMCLCHRKHISESGNKKTSKCFRTEAWVDEWIRQNDIDCRNPQTQ